LLGITKWQFESWATKWTKENFDANFQKIVPGFLIDLREFNSGIVDIVRNSHQEFLGQNLTPDVRAKSLAELKWKIVHSNGDKMILPDCVGIAVDATGSWRPYIMSKGVDVVRVFMPLSSGVSLCAAVDTEEPKLPDNFNRKSASCSWKFFVAAKNEPALDALVPCIGSILRQEIGEVLNAPIYPDV
jgi:hypothetical protein